MIFTSNARHGLRYGLPPLIHGLTYALWMADENHHFKMARDWDEVDTDPGTGSQVLTACLRPYGAARTAAGTPQGAGQKSTKNPVFGPEKSEIQA